MKRMVLVSVACRGTTARGGAGAAGTARGEPGPTVRTLSTSLGGLPVELRSRSDQLESDVSHFSGAVTVASRSVIEPVAVLSSENVTFP